MSEEIMKLETKTTTKPVVGEVETRLELTHPKRSYVARSETKDGEPEWVVALGVNIHDVSRHAANVEIEKQDLRAFAAMLIAHADALEGGNR